MTGLFLVIWGALALLFLLIIILRNLFNKKHYYDNEGLWIVTYISGILFACWLIAIPISRIDSKANALKVEALKTVIEHSRTADLSEFERLKLIEEITIYNERIATWKTKGKKWYNNKWYYYPECKNIDFIK
jgi:hypothetical protein